MDFLPLLRVAPKRDSYRIGVGLRAHRENQRQISLSVHAAIIDGRSSLYRNRDEVYKQKSMIDAEPSKSGASRSHDLGPNRAANKTLVLHATA